MTEILDPSAPSKESRCKTREEILIVDDDRLVLSALAETIKREGYPVLTAQNGEEAIQKMTTHPIALIICDQRMPGLSGIEVLKKALIIRPEAIRVVLTGNSDLETVMQAINVGQISQFILKPWEDISLRQTINSCIEKYRLVKENQNLHHLIFSQHKELAKNHETLRHELQLGARIHETLLLGKVPRLSPGFDIAATTVPSKDIDGDFFEFYRPNPAFLDVILGDVMGKGIPAALVGIAVKTQLMRFAIPFMHTQVFDNVKGLWQDDLLSPQEILAHVHAEISNQLIDLEYFVCLFYGRFNTTKRTFTYVDCGATKPIHYRAKQKKAFQLSGNSFPIGMVTEDAFSQKEVLFSLDDIVVFYSDGITEARSPQNEFYGVDRLVEIIEKNSSDNAQTLLSKVKNDVLSFAQKETFDDDLTLLIVKIGPSDLPKISEQLTVKFNSELSQLKAVRQFVQRCCQKAAGNSEKLTNQLQLAINESFCNIAIHGYKNEPGHPIIIQCDIQEDGILFQLSDQGEVFDPTKIPEPDLTGGKDHGFGWFIIREIADRIFYLHKESDAGWNHLQIFKRYYCEEEKMEVEHKSEEGVLIITPEGSSLDAKEAPEFKEKVINIISNDNANNVIFDLHRLQFIDSSGLGSFLSVLRVLHTRGGELKLANMNKPIRTMFELVSMHKIFEIFHSTEDAVRSFKS